MLPGRFLKVSVDFVSDWLVFRSMNVVINGTVLLELIEHAQVFFLRHGLDLGVVLRERSLSPQVATFIEEEDNVIDGLVFE